MDALQMAPNLAGYNAMPALLAHSYLVLSHVLKILALHASKVARGCYLVNILLVSVHSVDDELRARARRVTSTRFGPPPACC